MASWVHDISCHLPMRLLDKAEWRILGPSKVIKKLEAVINVTARMVAYLIFQSDSGPSVLPPP